jgi:hypothetical protein
LENNLQTKKLYLSLNHTKRQTNNKTMKNQTIEQLQNQIEIVNEIQSLILKLFISEVSESSTKTELTIIDEKFENYKNFKITKLTTLQNKN